MSWTGFEFKWLKDTQSWKDNDNDEDEDDADDADHGDDGDGAGVDGSP